MNVRKKNKRLERNLERKCVEFAKGRGWLAYKLEVAGERGWPDRVFLFKGLSLYIEFKIPGKKPQPLQAKRLRDLTDNGFHADCITDFDAFKKMVIMAEGVAEMKNAYINGGEN